MKLLHFADLHLDSSFTWAPPRAASLRRQNLRATLRRIIELADEIEADALLIAGDLYEQERFTPDTAAFLRETLNGAGRPIFISPGNHDWFGPDSIYRQTHWGDHVHIFSESALRAVELDDGLTFWGAAHCVPANTNGFLASGFRVDRGGLNLALFHGSEQGAMRLQPTGKVPHAPFTSDEIERSGLAHVFCGHFHSRKEADLYTYPGSPDPLAFGDSLESGAVEVNLHSNGTMNRTFHRVSTSEVHDLSVDLSGSSNMTEVQERLATALRDLGGFVRVSLSGEVDPALELDIQLLENQTANLEALVVRADGVRVGYDLDSLEEEQTVRGQFIRDVRNTEELSEGERRRILTVGLRALDGRRDLEVV